MKILEVNNVSKSFSNKKVIDNLSFSVEENTVLGFIGPNGAGKTTTMKMILGLLKIDSGNIVVNNETVKYGYTNTNKVIGYLPDVPEYYGYMKPIEYLRFCAEVSGINMKLIEPRCSQLLKVVGLDNSNKKISTFSRGMKQRLGIAQALINSPKLLICDEPTSALDPIGRKEILEILHRIKEKTTVIFSTHILSDVEKICDTVLVINNGKVVMNGSIHDIKEKYKVNKLFISFENVEDKNKFIKTNKFEIENETDTDICITFENNDDLKSKILEDLRMNNIFPTKMEIIMPTIEDILLEVVK